MSRTYVCSSPAHQRPGDCLAAPAVAGQGVGILSEADREYLDSLRPSEASLAELNAEDRERVEALAVLREMFYLQERQSPEGKARSAALSEGIFALHVRLVARGIDA